MDGMLSQEEINALLGGMGDSAENTSDVVANEPTPAAADSNERLSPEESDALGEIANISMGTAATTLSVLVNNRVEITTPKLSYVTLNDLKEQNPAPCVFIYISYRTGLEGKNILVLKEHDVKVITDLMMGGTGQVDDDEPLSELHLSAIGEAMNQMMGSAATSMSSMFNRKIDISPPIANMVETYSDSTDDLPPFLKGQFVMVAFKMQIGDLIDSEIMQLYPIEFAKELLNLFTPELNGSSSANVESQPAQPEPVPQPTPAPQPAPAPAAPQPDMSAQAPQGMPYGYPQMGMPYGYPPMQGQPMAYGYPPMQGQSAVPQQDVNVAPAAFQPFAGDVNALSQKENIDLIMDVPLDVTVELGRTKKSIKDILEFAPGTIVELNKIAGEAIDVLVNGKYVAKGEVVVIEESFGVRITEIIKEQ